MCLYGKRYSEKTKYSIEIFSLVNCSCLAKYSCQLWTFIIRILYSSSTVIVAKIKSIYLSMKKIFYVCKRNIYCNSKSRHRKISQPASGVKSVTKVKGCFYSTISTECT